jgi:transcriptional regulator with XRE-family HTH domain
MRIRRIGKLVSMSELGHIIGQIVREYREKRQLSQESLAALSGLSRPYIGEIERGESNLSFTSLLAVAHGLGTPASELVREYERRAAHD